jgi:hypothetical protein
VRVAAIKRDEENAAKLASCAAAGPSNAAKHDWTHHFKAAREQPAAFRAAKPDPFVSPLSATPSAMTATPPRPASARRAAGATPTTFPLHPLTGYTESTPNSPSAMLFPGSHQRFSTTGNNLHLLEDMPESVNSPIFRRASAPNLPTNFDMMGNPQLQRSFHSGALAGVPQPHYLGSPHYSTPSSHMSPHLFRSGIDIGGAHSARRSVFHQDSMRSMSQSMSHSHGHPLTSASSPPSAKRNSLANPFDTGLLSMTPSGHYSGQAVITPASADVSDMTLLQAPSYPPPRTPESGRPATSSLPQMHFTQEDYLSTLDEASTAALSAPQLSYEGLDVNDVFKDVRMEVPRAHAALDDGFFTGPDMVCRRLFLCIS